MKYLALLLMCGIVFASSGCLLAVAGAGAAGGVYVDKNYDISVEKKKDEKPDDT